MHKTRNSLTENVRSQAAALLNRHLSLAIDLHAQTKQAHWNVKGPTFIALHELFDKLADEVEEFVDTIAERVTALGGTAEGTIQVVVERSQLPRYPLNIDNGKAHLEALSGSLAAFANSVRKAIDEANALGDADTADLFTGISRESDKQLWLLEAHLQA
jgi:starvation-inducible DNA-binding protein